jgi:hypothetical protein
MTPTNWAGLIVSIIAIVSAFAGSVRWLVKHYLYELKPNSGTSMRDSINRLEAQVEIILDLIKNDNGRKNERN